MLINIVICFINLYIYRGRGCPITDMSQSWKRRVESNVHFQGQLPPQRTIGKDIPIMDPNLTQWVSLGLDHLTNVPLVRNILGHFLQDKDFLHESGSELSKGQNC